MGVRGDVEDVEDGVEADDSDYEPDGVPDERCEPEHPGTDSGQQLHVLRLLFPLGDQELGVASDNHSEGDWK